MKIQDMAGIAPELRRLLSGIMEGLSGDIALRVSPATLSSSAVAVNAAIDGAAGKYTRTIVAELVDSDGEIHKWFNGSMAIAGSESTAGDGEADTSEETVTFVNGVAEITLEYVGNWAAGTAQVETATAAGEVTKAGNAKVTVTSTGMPGSPKTISVPVELGDTANEIALAIRTALAEDTAVAGKFIISGEDASVVLTAKVRAANDTNLNIAIDNDTSEGVTTAATSANTTPGVAPDTATMTITGGTVLGYTVANKTSVDTLGV